MQNLKFLLFFSCLLIVSSALVASQGKQNNYHRIIQEMKQSGIVSDSELQELNACFARHAYFQSLSRSLLSYGMPISVHDACDPFLPQNRCHNILARITAQCSKRLVEVISVNKNNTTQLAELPEKVVGNKYSK